MSKREAIVFGRALAEIRRAKGLNQQTLARRSEVSEGLISNLELGNRHASRDNVEALGRVLDSPVESFSVFVTPDQYDVLADLLPALARSTRDEVLARAERATETAA